MRRPTLILALFCLFSFREILAENKEGKSFYKPFAGRQCHNPIRMIKNVHRKCLRRSVFVFLQLWPSFYAIGQVFIVVNGQIFKHWKAQESRSKPLRPLRNFNFFKENSLWPLKVRTMELFSRRR